ncbi:MAG: hypothetical protein U9O50_06260 [Acidobacteriota bacterium]|nr:hypothetical protein [Acidobacteriota bacterium]
MKKFLVVSLLTIMVIFSFSLALEAVFHDGGAIPIEDIGGNFDGSGATLWDRHDINCKDPKNPWREKTQCFSGGKQQCTAKYCN